MKFTSKLVRKANRLFKAKTSLSRASIEGKKYLSDAYKQAIKYFKALWQGKLHYFALNGDRPQTLEVLHPAQVGVNKKFIKKDHLLFYFIDKVKFLRGDKEFYFSINNFQLI